MNIMEVRPGMYIRVAHRKDEKGVMVKTIGFSTGSCGGVHVNSTLCYDRCTEVIAVGH